MMKVRTFPNASTLTDAVFDVLRAQFAAAADRPTAIMLAGGSTPMAAYARLAAEKIDVSPKLHLMFSDDRHVPPDSTQSNYGNTLPMIRALALPAERVLRVYGELPLDEAAAKYDHDIGTFLDNRGTISTGFLGLGADGHTASLFSKVHIEEARGRNAIAVKRPDGMNGVSVSPSTIARVARVIFLVIGKEKRAILKTLLTDTLSIPAGLAVADNKSVEVWCDSDASPM